LPHAPDYRESFLRELSNYCILTVLAYSCKSAGLTPPPFRKNYHYIELDEKKVINLRFNNKLVEQIKVVNPDVICIALDIHYPTRIAAFLLNPHLWKKWVWWGQIYGRSKNKILNTLKIYLIDKSYGALVYNDSIQLKLETESKKHLNVLSFNNSQFSSKNFEFLPNTKNTKLHCLFVGRPQKRKRLELLIDLAKRRQDLIIRLVGPGMEQYMKSFSGYEILELFPSAKEDELNDHFLWSNIVINPGHVGLLVMNAASHNRAIVIDSKVNHAPELILAKETNQFFVDFEDISAVDKLLYKFIENPSLYIHKGEMLYKQGIKKYTTEKMAQNHMKMFNEVINSK